jgi:hypothetical protein
MHFRPLSILLTPKAHAIKYFGRFRRFERFLCEADYKTDGSYKQVTEIISHYWNKLFLILANSFQEKRLIFVSFVLLDVHK